MLLINRLNKSESRPTLWVLRGRTFAKTISGLSTHLLWLFFLVSAANAETVDELFTWLESGTNRTLIVSRAFLDPPVFSTGEALYKSEVERDEYYCSLGIWQKGTRCKEYKIQDIKWTDKIVPQGEIIQMPVFALVPEKDIKAHLPLNSEILLSGKNAKGENVPLIYEVTNKKNRIINITFSLKPNFRLEKSITWNILNYIAKENKEIMPVISCTAHTGLPLYYKGKFWESSESLNFGRYATWDMESPHQGKGSLSQVLFSCPFIKNGKPVFAGINLYIGPVNPIRFVLLDKVFETDLVSPRSMFISSIDKSAVCSNYASHAGRLTIASANTPVQWILETLDGQDYIHTDIFRLFTEQAVEFSFLRPDFWVEDELIHIFKLEGNKLNPAKIIIDKNILIVNTDPGNYIVYYGRIQQKQLTEFWKKFLNILPEKKVIPGESTTDYSEYINDWDKFSINWIEM